MPQEQPPDHPESPTSISRDARIGIQLFCIYGLLYTGFMAINVFRPDWMAQTEIVIGQRAIPLGGLNLAIVYGGGLILAAIALSLVYMRLTRRQN